MPRTKKKLQYPRKLRVKLEKVASRAETRQAESEARGARDQFPRTFWQSFYPTGSIQLMTARVDDVLSRFESTSYLEPQAHAPRVQVPPPWDP